MPRLLKDRAFVSDPWEQVAADAAIAPDDTPLLLPLARWQEQRAALLAGPAQQLGIWLDGDAELADLAADIERLDCIAIRFPAFMDGRGFSTARLLRERHGYRGELRAIGDIIPDQLHYLWRCGFDAFELSDTIALETALGCLDAFSTAYQTSARPAV